MEGEASTLLVDEGFDADRQQMVRTVDVRYAGQEHSVTIEFPADGADVVAQVSEEFARLHERQYGHTMEDPIEITTLRVRATGVVDKPSLPRLAERTAGSPEPAGLRRVYVSADEPEADYALYTREALLAGDVITGPAVIAEHTATTVMHAGDALHVGPYGELVITMKPQA